MCENFLALSLPPQGRVHTHTFTNTHTMQAHTQQLKPSHASQLGDCLDLAYFMDQLQEGLLKLYLSERFRREPLYNLAVSTLSARLRLIFSVIKADTKEYPCSCPVRSECCASFLCPSQSLLAVLFRRHISAKYLIWYCANFEKDRKCRVQRQRGIDYQPSF